jgi:peptidoglycan hydrolase-like protein with peptidoglycan-binding domain
LWILNVDGNFGAMVRDAIFSFQSVMGMPITGVVNQAAWDRLFREAAACEGSVPPTPEFPSFPGMNLQQGSSGANVRLIQEAINRLAPCHPGRLWILNVDGNFGAMVRDAIFSFQSVMGMPITGVVNQATWDRLFREAAACQRRTPGAAAPSIAQTSTAPIFPGALIRLGSSGEDVRLIQQRINELVPKHPGRLWEIPACGIYSMQTRDAIFTFQRIFGLTIDGVVGPITWEKLFNATVVEALAYAARGGY